RNLLFIVVAAMAVGATIVTSNILRSFSTSIADMAERAKPALVFVSVSKKVRDQSTLSGVPDGLRVPPGMEDFFDEFVGEPHGHSAPGGDTPSLEGIGSGFFVDVASGYIVTNNHVVEGA